MLYAKEIKSKKKQSKLIKWSKIYHKVVFKTQNIKFTERVSEYRPKNKINLMG